jgi:hypothetical protein
MDEFFDTPERVFDAPDRAVPT